MCETERLAFNVLRRDKDALRRLAAIEGEAMSVMMRRLIRQAAREYGLLASNGGTTADNTPAHAPGTTQQEVTK